MSNFYDLQTNREIIFPNRILWDIGADLFNTEKTGTVPGKPGLLRSLVSEECTSRHIECESGKMSYCKMIEEIAATTTMMLALASA
jgi:hypothetical protein